MSKKGKPASKPYAGKSAAVAAVKRPAVSQIRPASAPTTGSTLSDLRLRRMDYTGTLVTLGPVHVGTGESELLTKQGSNSDQTEFALIWRDCRDAPWLPPTTLKGLLKALDEQRDADHVALFGALAPKAVMGALRFKGAVQSAEGVAVGAGKPAGGASVLTRTAIDPGRGTAKRNQLFAKEFIGTGAKFTFFLRLEGRHSQVDFERLQERVQFLLSRLSSVDGVAIGALGKQGEGRIRLEKDAKRQRWQTSTRPDTLGALVTAGNAEHFALTPVAARTWRHKITLGCSVPFLISDGHYDRAVATGSNPPHLIPVRDEKGAVTSASSILGVLRGRACWLVAIAGVRKTGTPSVTNSDVDLLFGTTGRKGLIRVQIDRKKVTAAPIMTQVKIDRFSGAGMEGALVSTQGDLVTFDLGLDIARPEAGATTLLDLLAGDIKANGLQLGHSTTRGFGWFEEVPAP